MWWRFLGTVVVGVVHGLTAMITAIFVYGLCKVYGYHPLWAIAAGCCTTAIMNAALDWMAVRYPVKVDHDSETEHEEDGTL